MEKKRDWVAVLWEAICWIALIGAEFFFFFSFLPWKFLWIFLFQTLFVLAFALARRKLSRKKFFLRIAGAILAAFTLATGWICFSDASLAFGNLWCTEDLAHYDHLKGGPFLQRKASGIFSLTQSRNMLPKLNFNTALIFCKVAVYFL